jgi:hypothetical protein
VGEANSRVAGRTFNDSSAWAQQTGLLSVLDDKEGRAVLDTAAGVLELCFA